MHMITELERGTEPEFVRDKEGAQLARMSINTFRQLAEEFGAVYRVGKTRLTNWSEFKAGLEKYRLNPERNADENNQ